MTGSMTNIAATAPIALIAAATGPAAAQASLYAGDSVLAATTARENPKRARMLYTKASELGHVYAARQFTHPLANPPGETEVTTKGGFGENQ